jgi:1-acyl-sn-glycerol-3-phosphate acyltransferase
MRRLRGLLIGDPSVILSTLVFGIVSYVVSFFDPDGRKQAVLARNWSKTLLWGCGIKVVVQGLEQIDTTRSYIFIANHLSFIDSPVILANIPVQFRFLAKLGLFQIPLLGGHLKRGGHIPVPRTDPRGSVKTMQTAAEVIRNKNISLLVFPEGGRSHHGVLQAFKEGGAYIAIRAGVPVVPTVLLGSQIVLPYGAGVVEPGVVRLRLLKPIPTTGLTLKDRGTLTQQLREVIAAELRAAGFQAETSEESQSCPSAESAT